MTLAPLVGLSATAAIVAGVQHGHAGLIGFGGAVSSLLLWPLLLGVRLDDGVLEFGPLGQKRRIALGDVEMLLIGRVEGFGGRGTSARGMIVVTSSGERVAIQESRFCSTKRLDEWARRIVEARDTAVEVVHQPVILRYGSGRR